VFAQLGRSRYQSRMRLAGAQQNAAALGGTVAQKRCALFLESGPGSREVIRPGPPGYAYPVHLLGKRIKAKRDGLLRDQERIGTATGVQQAARARAWAGSLCRSAAC